MSATAPPKSPAAIGAVGRPRADWLALQAPEPILEPERPIVDPHGHLWDHPANRYLLPELLADTGSGHRVIATVYVDCLSGYRTEGPPALRPVGETEFAAAIAEQAAAAGSTRACAGIVGFADLTLGAAVREVLQAHLDAGRGRFRGIRHAAAWDASPDIHNAHTHPPPRLYADAAFRAGFAQLGAMGLSFEAWQFHPQLPEVTALAQAFPETTIVLNHCGGVLGIGPYAGQQDAVFAQWRADLAALARCPNVHVKLGGLGMRTGPFDFHRRARPPTSGELAEAWRPWIETCIEAFGAERCLFESNFPVDKLSTGYAVLWNAFKRLAAGASETEKTALFSATAQRVYRL